MLNDLSELWDWWQQLSSAWLHTWPTCEKEFLNCTLQHFLKKSWKLGFEHTKNAIVQKVRVTFSIHVLYVANILMFTRESQHSMSSSECPRRFSTSTPFKDNPQNVPHVTCADSHEEVMMLVKLTRGLIWAESHFKKVPPIRCCTFACRNTYKGFSTRCTQKPNTYCKKEEHRFVLQQCLLCSF